MKEIEREVACKKSKVICQRVILIYFSAKSEMVARLRGQARVISLPISLRIVAR